MKPNRDCIETTTGLYYHFLSPSPEEIDVEDIASSLSHECRFGGFVKRFYPVAEHALLVRALVIPNHPELGFEALHHDSHEAYMRDIPKPIKGEFGERYVQLCRLADEAIGEAFGLDPDLFDHPIIKRADRLACQIEARALKKSEGRGPHWESYWDEWGLHDNPPAAPWRLGMAPATAYWHFLDAQAVEASRRVVLPYVA